MARKKENLLEQIPCLKDALFLRLEEGQLFLIVPRKNPLERLAIKWLKQPSERKIALDQEGSFILQKVDGKRNVFELEQLFNGQFGNEDGMSLARLVRFLQIVDSYGWLKWTK
ncbi:PqqD family protein [Listeria costaricensis]|uniref:PqqD family protein n=1 Tax=Listeria costaricensis TaxID=2026604 RepID=UPI000C077070|nr:PqqD family protein [Listeria costaricensis]